MALLMNDPPVVCGGTNEHYDGRSSSYFGGYTFMSSKNPQRASYSTSHSETYPAVSCMAVSSLISSRFTEFDFPKVFGRNITIKDVLRIHLQSENHVSIDLCTDAINVFELVHRKAYPNDKHHRVGIFALREDRITHRLRHIVHLPTNVMLADP